MKNKSAMDVDLFKVVPPFVVVSILASSCKPNLVSQMEEQMHDGDAGGDFENVAKVEDRSFYRE